MPLIVAQPIRDLILILGLITLSPCATSGWYDTPNQAEGFYFYGPDRPLVEEPTWTEEQPQSSASSSATPDYARQLEQVQHQLKQLLSRAILYPTPQHIYAYQIAQQALLVRSEHFGQQWMRNVYLNPELDQTLKAPVNALARAVHFAQQRAQNRHTIQALAQEYGLFFFFSGQCAYCHEMAPIVQRFSDQYGWPVVPISLDGDNLPEFPNAQRDNGIAAQWHVSVVPALFAVHPRTRHILPIAQGSTPQDELERRIATLISKVTVPS